MQESRILHFIHIDGGMKKHYFQITVYYVMKNKMNNNYDIKKTIENIMNKTKYVNVRYFYAHKLC